MFFQLRSFIRRLLRYFLILPAKFCPNIIVVKCEVCLKEVAKNFKKVHPSLPIESVAPFNILKDLHFKFKQGGFRNYGVI